MYHGVDTVDIDPWGLFVTPTNFAEHLEVLNDLTEPMSLRRLAEHCRRGDLPNRASVVTIDDGYANIAHRAKPLLEQHGVPATLFAVSEPLHDCSEYWWDALAQVVLTPGELPPTFAIDRLGGDTEDSQAATIVLGAATHYSSDQWRADHSYRDEEGPAGPRMIFYRQLWELLLPLDSSTRRQALTEIADWAGRPLEPRATHRSMSVEELIELDGPVVEVGGHTKSHPLLPGLDPDRQRVEIEENKAHLESVLDRPVHTFSYPFGANDPCSVRAAKSAGYDVAVSARPETITADVDRHTIGRFDVKNWTGAEFERRLLRWFRYR